jgi:hypothetical protein
MPKKKISFPVIKGQTIYYPDKPLCPICGKNKVLEPHSMAILSADVTMMDRKKKCSIHDARADAVDALDLNISLNWHGAHGNGLGDDREIYVVLDIFKDIQGGSCESYFCSTQCLRTFLNACVDELESKVKRAIKKHSRDEA